jgi:DNA-binding MarR family transcriptional regulator
VTRYTPDKRGPPLRLSGTVSRLTRSLARFSFVNDKPEPEESNEFAFEVSEEAVTRIIGAWRERTSYLPGELFSDPAWGMLLELLQAEVQDRRVSLSRLCKVSGVSSSVAVRWLKALEYRGFAIRRTDPQHPNVEFVELSRKGSSALRRYFHEVVQSY